jgi:hypothetical protein
MEEQKGEPVVRAARIETTRGVARNKTTRTARTTRSIATIPKQFETVATHAIADKHYTKDRAGDTLHFAGPDFGNRIPNYGYLDRIVVAERAIIYADVKRRWNWTAAGSIGGRICAPARRHPN